MAIFNRRLGMSGRTATVMHAATAHDKTPVTAMPLFAILRAPLAGLGIGIHMGTGRRGVTLPAVAIT